MTSQSKEYVTLDEYFLLEDSAAEKYEYYKGEVLAMAGATEEHNRIVSNLIREAGNFLKGKDGDIFPSDFRVTTPAAENYFYPDATIVCGETEKQLGTFDTLLNPVVIFEVMSESTKLNDRGYKFFSYQQIPSLQEYVLIDSTEYAIDIISRQADGAWKFEKFFPQNKTITLQSIGLTFSFDDLYYKVMFPK